MADPNSWEILSRSPGLSSREADFFRCLGTIEDEVRRLPQNLCVLLTHTPLTQDGSRYSLFECGDKQRLGTHWRFEGDFVEWGHLPNFDQGTDRFPFGVVLSRTSHLVELVVDSAERTWLNFGGKVGFYVAGAAVRDSLPEGKLVREFTEMTVWHYFAENTGEPIPGESMFASVNEQLLHCYHGIRETFSIPELDWPEVLLYLGLKHPGPFFGVERESVVRNFQGEKLVEWGKPDERHHVFRIRPHSVARATSFALKALSRMVHFVDEPAGDARPEIKPDYRTVAADLKVPQMVDAEAGAAQRVRRTMPEFNAKAVAAIPMAKSPDGIEAESDAGISIPSSGKRSTERGENNSDPTILTESDRGAKAYKDGKQWCTAEHARKRFGIEAPQLNKASTRPNGLFGVVVERKRAQVGDGKKGIRFVFHFGSLQLLKDAIDKSKSDEE